MQSKRILRAIIIVLTVIISATVLAGCSKAGTTTPAGQVTTVNRGNLAVEITSAGNLSLSQTEDLAFEMAGTVESISVSAGDSVAAGQELAKLDTSVWEEQLNTLEKKLTTAQDQAEQTANQVTDAERQVITRQRAVTTKELDLQQAEISLRLAEIAVDNVVTFDEADELTKESKKIQVQRSQMALEDAQTAVNDAKIAIEDAIAAVDDAKTAQADADQAVKDAQSDLDEAKSLSPTITAPFAGFITKVNVKGGDDVQKGTVAVIVADPAKFEANILVSENDISKVTIGGDATVQVDALSTLTLPAKVTAIAPTATVSSGVVNYSVRVEVQSVTSANPSEMSPVSPSSDSAQLPTTLPSFGSGQRPTTMPQFPRQTPSSSADIQGIITAAVSQTAQLKDGMTVTVNIQVQQRQNVLLVLNGAITRKSGVTQVQLMNNGVAEACTIKTGISNWQYTEVTEGLDEGDEVLVTAATSSNTSQQGFGQGGNVIIPGGGGFTR